MEVFKVSNMEPPLPSTNFVYKKGSLARLGETLKENSRKQNSSFKQNTNFFLDSNLLTQLSINDFQILSQNGLIELTKKGYIWNFMPVFSDNLLFYCDLPKFKTFNNYVWLSDKFSGGSWTFARSLPVNKGDRVLDLGTGTGLLALMSRLKKGTVYGVDINPRAVQLAQFNRDLNGLNSVEFQVRNWNSVDKYHFDIVVSQPPFGFSLGQLGLAFNGGGDTGLEATKNIIRRFCPQDDQILCLFVHALENDTHSRFLHLLQEWIDDKSVLIDLQPQNSYSSRIWWERLLKKQCLNPSYPFPSEFQSYKEVVSYFVYLSR
ncbi:MAG: methyltransferase [Promethearchaeota archaeon]